MDCVFKAAGWSKCNLILCVGVDDHPGKLSPSFDLEYM